MTTAPSRLIGAAIFSTLCGLAQAAPIDPGPGTYIFSGQSTLTGFDQHLSCRIKLTGKVHAGPNGGVTLRVTQANATGDFASGCSFVGFDFPWTATVPASAITSDPRRTINIVFKHVVVKAAGQNCADKPATVSAQFRNGEPISRPSSLRVDARIGQCTIHGLFHAQQDVNLVR